jgi:hypothetical protein
MLIQNIKAAQEFQKYFELFNETVEHSTFFTRNGKDIMQENFKEISKIIALEIELNVNAIKVFEAEII